MAEFVVYILIMFGLGLGIGYLISIKTLGRQAATRHIRYALPWTAVGFILAFVLARLGRSYGGTGSIFPIIYIIGMGGWLLDWFIRRQNSGSIVFNTGKTIQNKILFWMGILVIANVLFLIWTAALTPYPELAIKSLSPTILFLLLVTLPLIAVGLSGLELREKGVCFMLTFISWQQMKSYDWEVSKPNTLTLRYRPRFPLMPGFMSIRVPAAHHEKIDRILKLHIPSAIAA